jgi:hypothetical protein
VPDAGLDAEKLTALRQWAVGLQGDARAEVSASGRAILMLVDEVERLHVLIWGRTLYPDAVPEPPVSDGADEQPDVATRLRDRVARFAKRSRA